MMLENIREEFINDITIIELVIFIIRVSFLLIIYYYFLSLWIDLGTL